MGEDTRGFGSVRAPGGFAGARIGLGGAVDGPVQRICLRERGGFAGPVAGGDAAGVPGGIRLGVRKRMGFDRLVGW